MTNQVTRRIIKGLGANAVNQGVTIIVQLMGVPLLLHAWGARLYGEWLILFAIPAYLSMTDLGFSQSAGNDMTSRVSRADREGALSIFQTLFGLVLSTSSAGLAMGTAFILYLPLSSWLGLEAIDQNSARVILVLLAVEVAVRLLNGVTNAGYRANGDYALHVTFDSVTRLIQYACIWIAAVTGHGPVASAVCFVAVRILATPIFAFVLISKHGWLRFGLSRFRIANAKALLLPALANMALPLAQALNLQGMVLVVGATLGAVQVVVFSTLRTLTRLALQLILAISYTTEPELAAAHGVADKALMRAIFYGGQRFALWSAVVAAACLTVGGGWVIDHWTGGKVAINRELFFWLLASAVAGVFWYGSMTVLKSVNQHLRITMVIAACAAGTVLISSLLLEITHKLAPAGAVLFVADIVMGFVALRSCSRLLEMSSFMDLVRIANPVPIFSMGRHFMAGRKTLSRV